VCSSTVHYRLLVGLRQLRCERSRTWRALQSDRLSHFAVSFIHVKLRPHQQQCRSNEQRSTLSKQHSTLLPIATMSNAFIVKFRPFDKVETNCRCSICFDFVERIVRLVVFDNVASTLLLVWTGLNTVEQANSICAAMDTLVCQRQAEQLAVFCHSVWPSVRCEIYLSYFPSAGQSFCHPADVTDFSLRLHFLIQTLSFK